MIYNLKPAPSVTLGQCSGQCQGCPGLQGCPFASQGLGAISLPGLGEIDWKWILIAIAAGLLAWRLLGGRAGRAERVRRRRLARAKAQYELAQI